MFYDPTSIDSMLRMEILFLTNIIKMNSNKYKWIVAHYFEEHMKKREI